MFYFGYVSKEQFTKRLRRELRRVSSKIEYNEDFCNSNTLVISTLAGSSSVLVITAVDADLGECLHIQIDLCEICLARITQRFEPMNPVCWENRMYGVCERKKLRAYCRRVANLVHEHISEVNNVQPSEFYEHTI